MFRTVIRILELLIAAVRKSEETGPVHNLPVFRSLLYAKYSVCMTEKKKKKWSHELIIDKWPISDLLGVVLVIFRCV